MLRLARAGTETESTDVCRLAELAENVWTNVLTKESELQVPVENATVEADKTRLIQMLENLFRNALDHNETPVTVRVGMLDTDGFYVEDTGRGIPVDDRNEIFTHGYTTNDD